LNQKILFVFLLFCQPILAQKSLLGTGRWFKIQVQKDQIYTLNSAFFKKNGIDFKAIDPRNVHVYCGQIGALPQSNMAPHVDQLIEIPVWCNDENGSFESKDFIKFYGSGPHQKQFNGRFSNVVNSYDDFAYYFVLVDNTPAKKIEFQTEVFTNADQISRGEIFEYEEKELKNILNSGRQWFGDFFYDKYSFKKPIINPNSPIQCQIAIMGVGRLDQKLDLFNGTEKIYTDILTKSGYNPSDTYDRYNRYSNVSFIEFKLDATNLDFQFKLATAGSANSGAYIDFIRYNYTTKITAENKVSKEYWIIADKRKNANLKIENVTLNYSIWDVSNAYQPTIKKTDNTGLAGLSFTTMAARIIVNDESVIQNPIKIEILSNQDILVSKVPEMLIVYPPRFKLEAEKLASHKKKDNNLETLAISSQDIYNAFSGGKIDPSAIRNYCRYLWKKNPDKFKFLLLFGDASFDYKNANGVNFVKIQDLIPTYQSAESLEPIYSFCSDDYFGFLEDSEGTWQEGFSKDNFWNSNTDNDHTLDIAIGRLPVKNIVEAQQMVNKLISYEKNPKQSWNTKLAMVADNRDYNIHTDNAENLSNIIKNQYGGFEVAKVYVDAFEVTKAVEVPKGSQELVKNIDKGTFLINYAGHGSESGWAQEKLLTLKEILAFKNTKWPIFFTATCQFGKFDNPNLSSGAELSLLLPEAGAIAFLTTTRPVYASTNEKINQAFYKNIRNYATLGELFKATKNLSQAGEVNRNFSLLGDPSLELPKWEEGVKVEKINAKVPLQPTLYPLENYFFEGKVAGINSGKLQVEILDKAISTKTFGAFPDEKVFEFQTQQSVLYRGEAIVSYGLFSINISLPKNQIQGIGKGLMKFIAISNDSQISKMGYFDEFLISSDIKNPVTNVAANINYTISQKNDLTIQASDDSGIYSGDGFDKIDNLVWVDDSTFLKINPQASFTSQGKNMSSNLNLNFLSPGKHKISIIIYDLHNNKAEKTFEIEISKQKIEIQNLVIYPNPIADFSYLILQHNRPQEDLTAICTLFDLNGRFLKKIEKTCLKCDEKWDFGLDFEQIYVVGSEIIYKIELISRSDLSSTTSSGRLLVLK
jgi:Peptidase family C25